MKVVKKDAFDTYKFNQFWKNDPDFQRFFKGGSKFSQGFQGDCEDLFTIMFKKKWKFDAPENDPHLRKFIESLKETDEYNQLRRSTVRKAGASFEAMKKLMESYDREGKDEDPQKRRIAARKAAKEAQQAADDYTRVESLCGLGCGEQAGEDFEAEEAERIKAVQKLLKNDFIKKILDMAGRMQSVATHAIESKLDRGDLKVVGVETGGDLGKILPSELCISKACEPLFIYRMIEKQLMQYRGEGKKPMGHGPIIVCIDESGSMRGSKNVFAKAFLFGMWVVAMAQRRTFHVIRFAYNATHHVVSSLKDITKLMEIFMGGGTSFEPPLKKAVEIISDAEQKNPEMKTADMIFLTDGVGHVSEKVLKEIKDKKDRLNFKVLSALIVSSHDMRSSDINLAKKVLGSFSDEVFDIRDIYKDNAFVKKALSIGGQ